MGKTVLVDLSHPFGRGNPLWPSNGDFHIDRVQHMPMHYRLLQTFNDFHMHNSTHADSPSHVIPESPYTHELPLENYYGPAVCLDIPKKHWELITVEDIEKAAAKVEGGIQEGDWVLICTGMNQRWGENDDYFMYSPGMSIEGAHWLRRVLQQHIDSGGALLISSHILAEVERMVDSIVVIKRRCLFNGSLDELRHHGGPTLEDAYLNLVSSTTSRSRAA